MSTTTTLQTALDAIEDAQADIRYYEEKLAETRKALDAAYNALADLPAPVDAGELAK